MLNLTVHILFKKYTVHYYTDINTLCLKQEHLCSMCQVFCAVGSDQQLLHHHILTKDVLLAYNIH